VVTCTIVLCELWKEENEPLKYKIFFLQIIIIIIIIL
jgi:hypothetical protein